jgi:hypothetical protein
VRGLRKGVVRAGLEPARDTPVLSISAVFRSTHPVSPPGSCPYRRSLTRAKGVAYGCQFHHPTLRVVLVPES